MNDPKKDIAPEPDLVEEDDEPSLPEAEEPAIRLDEAAAGSLAAGRDAIIDAIKHAPSRPGVYRMIDGRGDVLYVGKAKNIKKRIGAYARPTGLDTRIERMIAQTRTLEFVVTRTETEALLLEANLIKRLRPRFNVTLRDDKSFPYILITSDHWAPQILKHRGARSRPGQYYGPFASVWAVNRTVNALQRAFLLRSCSDPFFESRTRPCLLAIRSSAARRRAPRRSTIAIMRRWCAKPTRSCPAAASRSRTSLPGPWKKPRPRSTSSMPRSTATVWRRCRRSSRSRASIRAPSRRPTSLPCISRAASPASKCSSSAPGRTGATAPIFPKPTNRSGRAKCFRRSWRSFTTTSRRRA